MGPGSDAVQKLNESEKVLHLIEYRAARLVAPREMTVDPSLPFQHEHHGKVPVARNVVQSCAAGDLRGDECSNANVAVETAEGEDRFERFRGKK